MNQNRIKRAFSLGLVLALSLTSGLSGAHLGADRGLFMVSAAEKSFTGVPIEGLSLDADPTIKGVQNLGEIQNTPKVKYWYADNGFYGLKRNGTYLGENYDPSTWLLEDSDAIWRDKFLYTRYATTSKQAGFKYGQGNVDRKYDETAADENHYYQKILTYCEELWKRVKGDFSPEELSGVRTAEITTTTGSRSFEHPIYTEYGDGPRGIAASNSEDLLNFVYHHTRQLYEKDPIHANVSDVIMENGEGKWSNYDFISTEPRNASTVTDDEYNSTDSTYSDSAFGTKASNIYGLMDAHFYAPSAREYELNRSVIYKIYKTLWQTKLDVTDEESDDGLKKAHNGLRARRYLWSRTFAGLSQKLFYENDPDTGRQTGYPFFTAFAIDDRGALTTQYKINEALAVAPAFNLDPSTVVLARAGMDSAEAEASSSLSAVDPSEIGPQPDVTDEEGKPKEVVKDVEFVLESDSLSLNAPSISGKNLTNVKAGETYKIAYDGASTVTKEVSQAREAGTEAAETPYDSKLYVSAAIYDDANICRFYGVLGEVEPEGEGTVSLTIPEGLDAGKEYKLCVFEEQRNSGYTQTGPSGVITANSTTTPTEFEFQTYTTDYVSRMNVGTFRLSGLSAAVKDGETLDEDTSYTKAELAGKLVVSDNAAGVLSEESYHIISKEAYDALGEEKTLAKIIEKGDAIHTKQAGSKDQLQEIVIVYDPGDGSLSEAVACFPIAALAGSDYADSGDGKWYKVKKSGVEWNYKIDARGKICALYTEDDVSSLVDEGGNLIIPARLGELSVEGLGGGDVDTPVIPRDMIFEFDSIAIPEGVSTIHDYAFYEINSAEFSLRLPVSVKRIGNKAFAGSGISSLVVPGMEGKIAYRAFARTESLKSASLCGTGTGLSVAKEAFLGSALSSLSIKGEVSLEDNSFKDNENLKRISVPEGFTGIEGTTTEGSGEKEGDGESDETGEAGKNNETPVQTGIRASYEGKIMVPAKADKSKMTVVPVFEAEEKSPYDTKDFYMLRTKDFKTALSEISEEREDAEDKVDLRALVAAREGISVSKDELDENGTGRLSVAVVVFDENAEGGYYHTTVSIPIQGGLSDNESENVVSKMLDDISGLFSGSGDKSKEASGSDAGSEDETASGVDLQSDGETKKEYSTEKFASLKEQVTDLVDRYEEVKGDYDKVMDALNDGQDDAPQSVSEVVERLAEVKEESKNVAAGLREVLGGEEVSAKVSEEMGELLGQVAEIKEVSEQRSSSLKAYKEAVDSLYESLKVEKEDGEDGTVDLSDALFAISGLYDSISESEKRVNSLAAQNASLEAKNSSLSAEKAALSSDRNALETQNKALSAEKEELRALAETGAKELSEKNVVLEESNSRLETENKELQAKNEALQKKNSELANAGSAASDEKLKESYQKLEESYKKLETKNDKLSAKNSSLSKENKSLAKENKTLVTENKEIERESKNTESETVKKNESLKTENSSLKDQNSSLKTNNKELESENTSLSNKNRSLKKNRNSIRREKNSLKRETNSLKKERNALIKEKRALEKKNSRLEKQLAELKEGSKSGKIGKGGDSLESDDTEESVKSEAVDPDTALDEPAVIMAKNSYALREADTTSQGNVKELAPALMYTSAVSSNGKSDKETTDEQKEVANSVFSYYRNHPEKLAAFKAGRSLSEAIADAARTISIEAIGSVDIVPTKVQQKRIDQGKSVRVALKSDQFADGKLYLMVHESEKRSGDVDCLLLEAKNGTLDFSLPDLSPVSVAQVSPENAALFFDGADGGAAAAIEKGESQEIPLYIKALLMVLFIAVAAGLPLVYTRFSGWIQGDQIKKYLPRPNGREQAFLKSF